MIIHLFLALTVSIKWRLLFPTLCWSINTKSMVKPLFCKEEVRLRTADILDLNKAFREESIKSRKLSVALDATRAERNMLHKNYTESLDEIQDLKQKLKVTAVFIYLFK
jgi:hypothetical protein